MKRLILGAAFVTLLAGCDLAPSGEDGSGPSGGDGPAEGVASDLLDAMAGRGRLPQRDYTCRLVGSDAADRPYGTLGVASDRYTLVLKGGGRQEGAMTLAENHDIEWEGDLGEIDDAPRRVRRARAGGDGQTVVLTFDFAPATDAGHQRLICTARA